MARIKHNTDQRKDFFARLYAIYDAIPADFVNRVMAKMPDSKSSRIDNVRYGKTIDFDILALFEEMVNEEHKNTTA